MTRTTSLEGVRWKLASVWFIGSAFVFIVLVAQSLGGIYGDDINKAWAWITPNIAPTLSLMISIFAAYALMPNAEEDKYVVRHHFFRLSYGLSIFYVFNVLLVIIMAPFSVSPSGGIGIRAIDVLHTSNFWLGPLQGLTAATLAALFFTKTEGNGDGKKQPSLSMLATDASAITTTEKIKQE